MPAPSGRGILHPWPETAPSFSGVRVVNVKFPGSPDAIFIYLYFCVIDRKWYSAMGNNHSDGVLAWLERT